MSGEGSTAELDKCVLEFDGLDKDYQQLEERHKLYCQKVAEVKEMQQKCMADIAHQRRAIKRIVDSFRRIERNVNQEGKQKIKEIHKRIAERKEQFRDLEEVLPHENGLYLKIVLGTVNISLLSKKDKYKYKEHYEDFKLYVTVITLLLACLLWFVNYRVTDAAFQFLLVWYYCTLTIREHILKVNGSRIKGWWITHHFVSTVSAGIILIWPDGYTYNQFRDQFVAFSMYVGLVQVGQYYYQKGCLYRLRSLGERRTMDITVEGFQSWMWKGVTFVLPFLALGYIFQLYNAYTLFLLYKHPECREWQVPCLGLLFLVLFLGNSATLLLVVRQKILKREPVRPNKYSFKQQAN